ncbi:multiheme c-type cytochrome [Tautonia plasticadhaerens]|uniref:Cytochrome c-554 n=1 Tax=Tautonia plasticadhaerens TaxID=2527974 RepID=A0A518GY63_9BACT|nr:multiheme c-type cytochrome [Tautonia plasticadhaerens]QDV33482.1 Cytochrome c-554 precursor [Tautonia plasticadhaerens]
MTQRRSPWKAVPWVLIAVAILSYVGCSSGRKPGNPGRIDDSASTASPPVADSGEGEVEDGRLPDAILVVSGHQHGYLEPCGCTEGQSGGLGRRADLMNELRDEGRTLVPIDLGSIIADPAGARGGPDQVKIKLGIGLEALARLGYEALSLSADDLGIGLFDYFGEYFNVPDAPPLLATNVSPTENFTEYFRPSTLVEAGPMTIGILSVVDPDTIDALADPDRSSFFEGIRDPSEAIRDALPALEGESDVRVLMVQGSSELARKLGEEFPSLDVVVGASEYDFAPAKPERINDGRTLLVLVGKKGQQVGLVELFADDTTRPRYRRVALDLRYEDEEPIKSLLGEEYPSRLEQNDVLERFPRRPHPSGATFVGAETCRACHPATYQKWSTTKHAYAWPAIESGRRGDRTMDAECVSCHSTGFGFESGFVTAAETSHLRNQQCENCHGPGSLHVSDPVNPDYLSQVRLTRETAEKSLCISCHDSDNDPHWDFAERWPDVAHPGLDDYSDPKVRVGLDLDALPSPERSAEGD